MAHHKNPLKDDNFPSVMFMYINVCMYWYVYKGRCAKLHWVYIGHETKNKQCSSCILTTKCVTQTIYKDNNNVKSMNYQCPYFCVGTKISYVDLILSSINKKICDHEQFFRAL